jgi:hypothetical protein
MFTTRRGVWEASSGPAWKKLCANVDIGLTQFTEADELFANLAPSEVDDFTKVVLETTFGVERIQKWFVSA